MVFRMPHCQIWIDAHNLYQSLREYSMILHCIERLITKGDHKYSVVEQTRNGISSTTATHGSPRYSRHHRLWDENCMSKSAYGLDFDKSTESRGDW
jgi:hypothetical protein